MIVGLIHLGIGAGLYWVSQTDWGQNLIKVYKLNASGKKNPPLRLRKSRTGARTGTAETGAKPQEARPPPPQAEARPHRRPLMRLPGRRRWMRSFAIGKAQESIRRIHGSLPP